MWNEVVREFQAVSRRKYSGDPQVDDQIKKKILTDMLGDLLAALLLNNA